MHIQTEQTPNPNTLKFLPGRNVSELGPVEFKKSDDKVDNSLAKAILLLNGIEMVFFGKDFITVKKEESINWQDIKYDIISQINDYYIKGHEAVIKKTQSDLPQKDQSETSSEVIKKINEVLDSKIRPAVARDGGDIKFKSFKDGVVRVELQGSCSGCPSSIMTLKQGVQNLLCHYVPEVKQVEAI